MENTEQIVPDGNILMSSINDYSGVDDADDFYYNSEEDESVNGGVNLAESVAVDPQVFENAVASEAAPLSDIIDTPVNVEPVLPEIEPFNLDSLTPTQPSVDTFEPTNYEPLSMETMSTEPSIMDEMPMEDNTSAFTNVDAFEPVAEVTPTDSIINNNLTSEDIDKMIKSDEGKPLDDSYVLSNFDVLFDSLYNDVNGANNFISDLIERNKNVNVNEANLVDMKNKLEKEREEFSKFVEAQKQSIELEKAQCNEYVKNQRIRLQNEEEQFNNDCDATRAELKLEEEKIKIANEKLENEKAQFEKTREIEEEKIRTDRVKLQTEQEQFEKEKEIALERIKQGQKELQSQKEQFAKTKELEEKKLELESKNLSQSCARFKELVSQFNSGFQQLPGDKD